MVEYVVVLSDVVSERDVVEIFVDAVDEIVVDHIDSVDDVGCESERESHPVGEESSMVAHHGESHVLCVCHVSDCEHHHCNNHCSNLSHSRYSFVESDVFFLRINTLVLVFDAKVHNKCGYSKGLVLNGIGNPPNVSGNRPYSIVFRVTTAFFPWYWLLILFSVVFYFLSHLHNSKPEPCESQ